MTFVLAILAAAPHLAAPRLAAEPRLDGRVDDTAWADVPAFTDFTQKEPDSGATPSEPTRLRIAYDDNDLWIAVDCDQTGAQRIARLTRRDRVLEDDRVTIDLDTRDDGKSAFHFEVSAAGVLVDGVRFDDTELSLDWDENWEADVHHRDDGGWSAEIKLPLRILRFRRDTSEWGIQVRRRVAARREIDELAPIPRGEAGEVSRYGTIDAPAVTAAPILLEIRPFVLTRYGETATSGWSPGASAGGDAKAHLTSDLTLDLTVNPDFGQVEADQAVLNLSTFETFFPEKRPFFLEGAELFDAPIQALYTRRIGAAPDAPAVPDTETIVSPPGPAQILGAAKLTGTVVKGTDVAALVALTAPARALTIDAGDIRRRRASEPLTAFAAARIKHAIGERGFVGGFATAVVRTEDEVTLIGEDPDTVRLCPTGDVVAPTGECFHDAYVGGVDGKWRSPSGAYAVSATAAGSAIAGGPPRRIADGTIISAGDTGGHAEVAVTKENDGLALELVADASSRRFDVNDAGYLDRANRVHGYAGIGWRKSTGTGFLREWRQQVEIYGSTNLDGQMLSGGYQVNTLGTTRGGWSYFSELNWRPAHFDDREVGDGTALERAGRLGWEFSLDTDARRAVVASWNSAAQYLRGGHYLEGEVTVLAHVSSALDLEVIPTFVSARGEPRFVTTDASTGALVFGDQSADALGVALRSTYAFSPRATLQTFIQGFREHVHYTHFTQAMPGDREIHLDELAQTPMAMDDLDDKSFQIDANVVVRWEYRLGAFLSLVYTRSQPDLDADPDQVVLAKLSGWWGG